ncbi:hypothetical protein KIN20_025150 [Parelaphostrongylus tenuis]|uniref:Uncharacterized protein n=1 Tax=Parelaphostrongylus tenuis TaxID=148309 RepID=A0AAD5MZ51_PARTN|nr:hypothetical protein KIN20_025150 [Parelaphostrongylus tenuis]
MEVIEAPIAAVNAALGRVAGDWADSCVSNRTTDALQSFNPRCGVLPPNALPMLLRVCLSF